MHLNGTNKTPETGNKEMFVLLWIVSYIGVSLCSLMPSAANVVGGVGEKLVRRSRTLLSEGVVLFFTTCSVCLFFLLTRLLSNCWTNFHEIFTNRRLCSVIRYRWYPRKISPPQKKKWGDQKVHFWTQNSDLRCMEWEWILGKLKQLVYLQYLGYHHIQVWWNLVRGNLSYSGLINCAFWPMAHSASLNQQYQHGAISQSHVNGVALSKC